MWEHLQRRVPEALAFAFDPAEAAVKPNSGIGPVYLRDTFVTSRCRTEEKKCKHRKSNKIQAFKFLYSYNLEILQLLQMYKE